MNTKFSGIERELDEQGNGIKTPPATEASRTPSPLTEETQIAETPIISTADAEADVEKLPGSVMHVKVQVHPLPKEETPKHETADAEVQVEELPGIVKNVGVQLLPKEQVKMWEVCAKGKKIVGAGRRETAVVVGEDGIVEFYSSGKVVGHYLELEGVSVKYLLCSEEYIGVLLCNDSVACYRWLSDKLEWLYCLFREGKCWRRAEQASEVSICCRYRSIFRFPPQFQGYTYRQARDMVCCLYGGRVSGWSLSQGRTIFNIKVPDAKHMHMTPDLVLVEVGGAWVEVFTLEGSSLYIIRSNGIDFSNYPPLNNANNTALVSNQLTITWPTSVGQPVTKMAAFHSALHPHLPHVCSSVKVEPWELVLKDVSTNSVIWRRTQSGSDIGVFSIDSELLLIKPRDSPVQVLRWSSGEIVATLPVTGDYIRSASPQYIISDEQVFYRELT